MEKELKSNSTCFTIGHSKHALEHFLQFLKAYGITCLIDIRSAPYSKYVPQFNRESLQKELKKENLEYVYMGDCLGGRYKSPNFLLANGSFDFDKVRNTKAFIEAIKRVIARIKEGDKLALMCSEKHPLDCHRFVLVSKDLSSRGILVKHILEGGKLVSNEELEERLLRKYKKDYEQPDLFEQSQTKEEALQDAYRLRSKEIAYSGSEVKKV